MDVDFLREEHAIDKDSIFYVIGGHEGIISDKMIKKYDCHVNLFEPCSDWAEYLSGKYHKNPKVKIFKFGFAKETGAYKLYIHGNKYGFAGDGSNIYVPSDQYEAVQMMKFSEFITYFNVQKIDLVNINCEGSEYEIINDLYENDMLCIFGSIQVQFHNIEGYKEKLDIAREQLAETHTLKMGCCEGFEYWLLK